MRSQASRTASTTFVLLFVSREAERAVVVFVRCSERTIGASIRAHAAELDSRPHDTVGGVRRRRSRWRSGPAGLRRPGEPEWGIPQQAEGAQVPSRAVPQRRTRSPCRRLGYVGVAVGAAFTMTVACAPPLRLPAASPTSTAPAGPVHQLPGGGQVLFPGRRLIAIYGHPGDDNLGALGEQSVDAAVQRARDVASGYTGVSPEPVIPTFEIITTVASSEAGDDGDYSLESTLDHVRPWVDAAGAAGFYVVLDLQPGYTDFLTQAQRYEEFLVRPYVGLALDPEWRLAPGERHLEDIGQVSADEVNRVASWLAEVIRRHALPQKLLLLQQFRLDMLPDRAAIQVPPELALVVQMDGLGPQEMKLDTWRSMTVDGPAGVLYGWKNFLDEDEPLRIPAETVALQPSPVYISYQ